jgi:hypothetical protein
MTESEPTLAVTTQTPTSPPAPATVAPAKPLPFAEAQKMVEAAGLIPIIKKWADTQEKHSAEVEKALKQVLSNQVVLKRELDEIRGLVSNAPEKP